MKGNEGREMLTVWNGASPPKRAILDGLYVRLEPLDPQRHQGDLLRSALAEGSEGRFRFLFDLPPKGEADFAAWVEKAAASTDPLFYAVIDKATGRAEGRQSFMRIDATHGVIEIGNILWGPGLSRTRAATEAFYLFAAHAFDQLGYRRLEWKCDDRNAASKRAALRFGFTHEGVFRQHMVVKGENRNTAWFALLDTDWPEVSAALKAWLAPDNFDANGDQRHRLEALRR